jgi:GT2 family glycosyltransferase
MMPTASGPGLQVSIIIATHRREESLGRLLHALAPQIVPARHEILIADNGTAQPARLPADVPVAHHIHDPAPGKCRVQNRAIRMARGEILAFIDDDLTVASGYVAAVEGFFRMNPEYAAMKGKVLAAADPKVVAGDDWPYMDLPIVDHGAQVREVRGVLGANMAFRAAALSKVGPFDERLGPGACGHEEDTEISMRLSAAGLKIGYCPDAMVYHEVDPARADRARFLRVARERGRCRMLHEHHSRAALLIDVAYAAARLAIARAMGADVERIAREDRRLATALGMLDASSR